MSKLCIPCLTRVHTIKSRLAYFETQIAVSYRLDMTSLGCPESGADSCKPEVLMGDSLDST